QISGGSASGQTGTNQQRDEANGRWIESFHKRMHGMLNTIFDERNATFVERRGHDATRGPAPKRFSLSLPGRSLCMTDNPSGKAKQGCLRPYDACLAANRHSRSEERRVGK